jgi:AraC-like DNA-binding protein
MYRVPPGQVHTQRVLSFPNVHLAFEDENERRALVYGVPGQPFTRQLRGSGRVLGVRFRAGGFWGFWRKPVSDLTAKVVPAQEVWGPSVDEVLSSVFSDQAIDREPVSRFLAALNPTREPDAELAGQAVDRALHDPSLVRVEDYAAALGLSVRQLQRLFQKYVGVSPKWVLRRFRLQEAAQTLDNDPAVSWTDLALRLGYFDQAHFVNDFKAVLGVPPGEYRRGS